MNPDEIGIQFKTSAASVHGWRRRGAPIPTRENQGSFDLIALARWLVENLGPGSKSKPIARKIVAAAEPKKKATRKRAKKKSQTKTAEELRDDYFVELNDAKEAGDEEREKVALNAYLKIDKQIRDAEAHAKKLGIDKGDVLSKDECERIVRASCYAGNACVEGMLEQIAEKVSAMESPEQVYNFLKPVILGGRLFAGFSKVVKTPGAVNVPKWYAEAMQSAANDYLKGVKL